MKLKVLKRSSLLYNLPIFYIPKKARQKDPELFKAKESWIIPIQQIRRSPSFLGHQRGQFNQSFWQLKGLVVETRWTITTTNGFYNTNTILSRCPRFMESVIQNISNVIVYIDDLLLHIDTHEKHLKVWEHFSRQLQKKYLNKTWTNVCLVTRSSLAQHWI